MAPIHTLSRFKTILTLNYIQIEQLSHNCNKSLCIKKKFLNLPIRSKIQFDLLSIFRIQLLEFTAYNDASSVRDWLVSLKNLFRLFDTLSVFLYSNFHH